MCTSRTRGRSPPRSGASRREGVRSELLVTADYPDRHRIAREPYVCGFDSHEEVPMEVPVLALFLAEWRRVTPHLHC